MILKNKVAIVTGGGSGIGATIAIKLTQEGSNVTIVGRNREKLKNISAACEKVGTKPLIISADITKELEATNIITETIGFFGKIDILINNAGIDVNVSILDSNAIEMYENIMSTNLHAPVRLTHLAAKHLVETKGNIVNISSVGAIVAAKNMFPHCTSKAPLYHFARAIAVELGQKGVRVNNINPGPVRTDFLEALGRDAEKIEQFWEIMQNSTLLDRVSDTEEIAELVAFVVSNKGRSITGASLVIDNGMIFKGPMDFEM